MIRHFDANKLFMTSHGCKSNVLNGIPGSPDDDNKDYILCEPRTVHDISNVQKKARFQTLSLKMNQ